MEIRVDVPDGGQQPVAVTMRTPGHDFELAAGFLFTEGADRRPATCAGVALLRTCPGRAAALQRGRPSRWRRPLDPSWARSATSTRRSSCGVCGKATLDAIEVRCAPVGRGTGGAAGRCWSALPDALRAAQEVFDRTGGLHAAGLFDADGELRRACARTSAGTTPSTRSSVSSCWRAAAAVGADPAGVAAGPASRSCRRRPSPASRSSARCRRRPASPSTLPAASASRWSASCAATASTSTPARAGSPADGRPSPDRNQLTTIPTPM